MNDSEIIAKQQREIEKLKQEAEEMRNTLKEIYFTLWKPEQWDMKCPAFPKVAIHAICQSRKLAQF